MDIDYEKARYWRQYRDEPGAFRGLSILTKAVAAYLGSVVDPHHGWLPLRGDSITHALRAQAGGRMTRAECRRIDQSIAELLEEGYLVRCRVVDAELGTMRTHDQRDVPLSSWLEDRAGQWVVIADWVAAQHGLNQNDARVWHEARRERFRAAVRLTIVGS